jgi:hypothetical protein
MSEPEGTGKSDETSTFLLLAAWGIAATVSFVVHRYGCDWVAQHFPWLVNLISEPLTCILVGIIPYAFGYWTMRDPLGVVAMTVVLVVLPCASGAFGYWLSNYSWVAALVFGLGTFGGLVVTALMSDSGKTAKADHAGAKVPARASNSGNGKQTARLVASAVGIALSLPTPQ